MQEFIDHHKNIKYDYIYLEDEKAILVWKDRKLAYMIRVIKRPDFIEMMCNCWGDKRHGHCHHKTKSAERFNFSIIVDPEDWVKKVEEEYYINFVKTRKEIRK